MHEFTSRIAVDRPPQEVWRVLADFAHVADWVPFFTRSSVATNGELGVGSSRVLELRGGFSLAETVTEWEADRRLSYAVSGVPFPFGEVEESWSINPNGIGTTVTAHMSYRVRLGPVSALIDRLLLRPLLLRSIRVGQRGLKRKIEGS